MNGSNHIQNEVVPIFDSMCYIDYISWCQHSFLKIDHIYTFLLMSFIFFLLLMQLSQMVKRLDVMNACAVLNRGQGDVVYGKKYRSAHPYCG
jgi:hypothetical protein